MYQGLPLMITINIIIVVVVRIIARPVHQVSRSLLDSSPGQPPQWGPPLSGWRPSRQAWWSTWWASFQLHFFSSRHLHGKKSITLTVGLREMWCTWVSLAPSHWWTLVPQLTIRLVHLVRKYWWGFMKQPMRLEKWIINGNISEGPRSSHLVDPGSLNWQSIWSDLECWLLISPSHWWTRVITGNPSSPKIDC